MPTLPVVTYKPCCRESNITVLILQYVRPSTRFKKHQMVISFETGFHIKLNLRELQDLKINRYTRVEKLRLLLVDQNVLQWTIPLTYFLRHI